MAASVPSDVIVIGGGIAGVATAYYLARAGASVSLLDKSSIGSHQSGRNWGFTRRQGCDPAEVALAQHASCCWDGLAEEVGAELTLVKRGLLNLAATDEDLAGYRLWLDAAKGAEVFGTELVTAAEVESLLPAIKGDWAGGLYTPRDGHADPRKATTALAEACRRLGVTVEVDTTVHQITTVGDRVTGVRTAAETRTAGTVVCAAGAWASRLLRPLGVRLPVRWIRASAGRTSPAPLVTDLAVGTPGVGFSQNADGSVTFGTAAWSDYDIGVDTLRNLRLFLPNFVRNRRMIRLHLNSLIVQDVARRLPARRTVRQFDWPRVDDPPPNKAKVRGAHDVLTRLVPLVADTRIEHIWAGTVDVTPDALPVVGPVDGLDGLLLATGLSSHGFGIGPGVGHAVAQLAMTGQPPVDLSPFRVERFAAGPVRAHHHL